MTDSEGSAGAGWFHAQGDPPGTQRYWDGSAWQGDPQPVPTPEPTPPVPEAPVFSPPPTMSVPADPAGGGGAFGAPPAEAPKKRSAWKWILGVVAVLVLGIGGCTFAVWRAVSGPIDVGNEFLAALEARDFDAAWAVSDPNCFDGGSPQALADVFANDTVTAYELDSSNVNSTNGTTTGSTSGTVTLAGDDERTIQILASKDGDDWLVCGFDIAPAGG